MRQSRLSVLVVLGLIVLIAFAVRALSLDAQSLWRDEVDALRFATAPWAEVLSNFTRPGWNGPLYFLLLRGWVALTGTSEYAMRFFSLAFGVLTVPLIYVPGCRLFGRGAGLVAALLVTSSPYLTWYSQEVKMYALVLALALLAIYALRRAVEGGTSDSPKGEVWRWWAVQIVATSLAFYCHILAALLVPVQVLLYLVWWPLARRQWVGALFSLACLTLPYLPLAVWQVPQVLQERETGFSHYSLGHMMEILIKGWSTGILGWGWRWGTVLVGTLAGWGLVAPSSLPQASRVRGWGEGARDGLGNRIALLGWLVAPLLAVWLISLRQPLFTDRYLAWTAPALYLLVARGLASVWDADIWDPPGSPGAIRSLSFERGRGRSLCRMAVVLLLGMVLILSGVNLWQQATVPIKSDFRAAAAYLADRRESGELILFQIPYGRYTFNYYFPVQEYPWAEGLYTNHRAPDGSYLMSEQQAAYRMREMTAGYDVIWLVATEVEMWDARGLVQQWLETNAQRIDEAYFTRVDVYRYVMRGP